jgi:hypothetical protein
MNKQISFPLLVFVLTILLFGCKKENTESTKVEDYTGTYSGLVTTNPGSITTQFSLEVKKDSKGHYLNNINLYFNSDKVLKETKQGMGGIKQEYDCSVSGNLLYYNIKVSTNGNSPTTSIGTLTKQ